MDKITNEQRQLVLSAKVGDGFIKDTGGIMYSCLYKDYLEVKKTALGYFGEGREVKLHVNNGYKKGGEIYKLDILGSDLGKEILKMPVDKVIEELDEIGMCFWFYDDGSKHHKNLFYNLNSHALDLEIQQDILIPKLKSMGMVGAKITSETKTDGRKFYYVNIPKFKGAYVFDEILRLYDVPSYHYKLLPDDYKNTYTNLKREYSGLRIPQMAMSKVIKGILEEDLTLKSKLREVDGMLTYSKSNPIGLVETELVLL